MKYLLIMNMDYRYPVCIESAMLQARNYLNEKILDFWIINDVNYYDIFAAERKIIPR